MDLRNKFKNQAILIQKDCIQFTVKSVEEVSQVDWIYMDFSKAFDNMWSELDFV